MATTKGRALLVYFKAADTTKAAPATVAAVGTDLLGGCLERSITVANEPIDSTVAPDKLTDVLWGTALAGAKSVTVEASGRFTNESAELVKIQAAMHENSLVDVAVVFPPKEATNVVYGGAFVGRFTVLSWSASGSLSDTFNWSVSLQSNGAVTWVGPS